MTNIKLDLNNKSTADKLADGKTILTSTAGRADLDPERAGYAAAHAALEVADKTLADLRQQVKEAKSARDDSEAAHDDAKALLGKKVETVTKGDATAIIATGFKVRAEAAPAGEAGPVEGLTATVGDDDGEIDLAWDRDPEAADYEVQSADASDAGPWSHVDVVRASKLTVKGLKSGTRYWFRVRARGKAAGNRGPWSAAIARRAS